MTTTRERINEFLNLRRIAIVGVSRDPKDYSRSVFKEFRTHGCDVVPVNPNMTDVEGQPCYKRVQDIKPAVDGVLVLTPPQFTEQVVHDCADAGVKRVWIRNGVGPSSVSPSTVAFCEQNGISLVPGYCPFMFLPKAHWAHRIHGFVDKLTGQYPA
jgi:predicted CoA-binding protein